MELTVRRVVYELTVAASGPQGPPGPASGSSYRHTQATPAGTWIIPHNLGALTGLSVYIAGELVHADVVWSLDLNTTTVTFPTPVSGVAVLP